MRTTNPTLNENIFSQDRSSGVESMTIQGVVNKTFILLFILLIGASWVWSKLFQPSTPFGEEGMVAKTTASVVPFIIGGSIGGFILALVTIFKRQWSSVTAPMYALCEGLVLGGISALFELSYPGIVVQAVSLTFGTLFCLLLAYKSGFVTVTAKFRLGVISATGAICLIYFTQWILSFFNINFSFIHGNGIFGIAFSLFVVTIAALNLVLDFDLIDRAVQYGTAKYMEWYFGFALMVTLIWLYMEILRLLAKLRDRR